MAFFSPNSDCRSFLMNGSVFCRSVLNEGTSGLKMKYIQGVLDTGKRLHDVPCQHFSVTLIWSNSAALSFLYIRKPGWILWRWCADDRYHLLEQLDATLRHYPQTQYLAIVSLGCNFKETDCYREISLFRKVIKTGRRGTLEKCNICKYSSNGVK